MAFYEVIIQSDSFSFKDTVIHKYGVYIDVHTENEDFNKT